jgi:transcriptional regulator with GAF, ATPase, and Fis domain
VLQRLGAEQPTLVNVRVLAATNRRLDQAVAAGQFREDLFFRLNIFPIHLPPLRERLEDLPALVQHLARRARPGRPQQYAGEALALLRQHHWPGNIRELANVVERLAIIGGETLGSPEVAAILPGAGKRAEGPAPATPARGRRSPRPGSRSPTRWTTTSARSSPARWSRRGATWPRRPGCW